MVALQRADSLVGWGSGPSSLHLPLLQPVTIQPARQTWWSPVSRDRRPCQLWPGCGGGGHSAGPVVYFFSTALLSELWPLLVLRVCLYSPPASLDGCLYPHLPWAFFRLQVQRARSRLPLSFTQSSALWTKGLRPQHLEGLAGCSSHSRSSSPFSFSSAW